LGDHGCGGVGCDEAGEGKGEFARDEPVATAQVEEEGFGAPVVGEDCLEELGWVGGPEGRVGGGIEGCFAGWVLVTVVEKGVGFTQRSP